MCICILNIENFWIAVQKDFMGTCFLFCMLIKGAYYVIKIYKKKLEKILNSKFYI